MNESRPGASHAPQPGHSSHSQHATHTTHPSGPPQKTLQQISPGAAPPKAEDLEPIGLVEDSPAEAAVVHSKIKAFGVNNPAIGNKTFTRKTTANGTGACRVKTFHGRYSHEGMGFLDDAINAWLDQHPDVEVKFVTSTVSVFEGKIREPALVLNVWY